jgi:hypothetical protein
MSDRSSKLRSELRFLSDEFKNLVAGDLTDLKWKTFQMIIVTLFGLCPALAGCTDEISELLELRNRELSSERSASVSRENRQKSERAFRVELCQRILRGLELLKWPPAIAAFSNPLNDLLEESEVKLSAIEFIVQGLGRPHPASSSRREVHMEGSPVEERRRSSRQASAAADIHRALESSTSAKEENHSKPVHSFEPTEPLSSPMARVGISKAPPPSRLSASHITSDYPIESSSMNFTDYAAMRRTIEVIA